MNEHSHSEQAFDPEVLDRLVDGELPEGERREVLLTLDRQPDGWRRCALAFLEAQAWGQTLQHFVRQPSESESIGTASSPGGRPSPRRAEAVVAPPTSHTAAPGKASRPLRWRSWLAMAASFLITFGFALYAQRFFRSPPAVAPAQNIAAAPGVPVPASSAPEAHALASATPGSTVGNAAVGNATVGNSAVGNGTMANSPIQMVDLNLTTPDGQQQRVRVPLVNSQFAPYVLPPQPPAIPENVREALARAGSQLQVKREYWPVQYGNRQAVVPIDRIEIVPVGNRMQ